MKPIKPLYVMVKPCQPQFVWVKSRKTAMFNQNGVFCLPIHHLKNAWIRWPCRTKKQRQGCGGTHLVGFRLSLYDFLTNSNPHSLGHNLYIYGPYGPYGHTKKNTNELELPVDHHSPLI